MPNIADILVIILSFMLMIKHFKNITFNTRYVIYFIFVFLYVLPIALDCLYLRPDYSSPRFYGFRISSEDEMTRFIYDILLIYSQIIILRFRRNLDVVRMDNDTTAQEEIVTNYNSSNYSRGLLVFFSVMPAFLSALLRFDTFILYTPQWREIYTLSFPNYSFVEKLSYVGATTSILVLFGSVNEKRLSILRIIGAIFLYINICIEGKRSILFFSILIAILIIIPGIRNSSLSIKSRRQKMILAIGLIALAGFFVVWFTVLVKTTSRGYSADDTAKIYTTIRIDIFRDDRVRMAIYSLIHPENMRIVDSIGATIFSSILFLFPLDFIRGIVFHYAPLSYTAYLSAALINSSHVTADISFMTPSIFAEMISNFGWVGLLISPFLFCYFIILSNRNPYPYNLLVLIVFVAIQMYSLGYMMYLIEFVILIFISRKVKFKFGR